MGTSQVGNHFLLCTNMYLRPHVSKIGKSFGLTGAYCLFKSQTFAVDNIGTDKQPQNHAWDKTNQQKLLVQTDTTLQSYI